MKNQRIDKHNGVRARRRITELVSEAVGRDGLSRQPG